MNTTGLDRAYETTKQVITLSTGIIALTVTFAKEFKVSAADLTVPFSELDRGGAELNRGRKNIKIPAGLMIITFVGGIVTTIWSGFLIAR